jgi:hypothetical protein
MKKYYKIVLWLVFGWSSIYGWAELSSIELIEKLKVDQPNEAALQCGKILTAGIKKIGSPVLVGKMFHTCTSSDLFFRIGANEKKSLVNALVPFLASVFDEKIEDSYSLLGQSTQLAGKHLDLESRIIFFVNLANALEKVKVSNIKGVSQFTTLNQAMNNYASFLIDQLLPTQGCQLSTRYLLVSKIFLKDPMQTVENHYQCIRAANVEKKFSKAISMINTQLALKEWAQNPLVHFFNQIEAAVAHREVKNLDSAKKYFDAARVLLAENRRERLEAWLEIEQALFYARSLNKEMALRSLNIAKKIYDKANSTYHGLAYVREAAVHRKFGDEKAAERALGEAQKLVDASQSTDLIPLLEYQYELVLLKFGKQSASDWNSNVAKLMTILKEPTISKFYQDILSPLEMVSRSQFKKSEKLERELRQSMLTLHTSYQNFYKVEEVENLLRKKGFLSSN